MARTQAESEQLVKTYQLDAVEGKVDTVLTQLRTIVNQTAGLATVTQLEAAKLAMKDKLDEAIKDVQNEYRPTLKRNKALWGLVGALVLAIVAQAIIISSLRK